MILRCATLLAPSAEGSRQCAECPPLDDWDELRELSPRALHERPFRLRCLERSSAGPRTIHYDLAPLLNKSYPGHPGYPKGPEGVSDV